MANLDRTLETSRELMSKGVVPTTEQLLAIWHAHEKLGDLYTMAEKARVKK